MTEAVIVATARTPIGRAFKGSLKDIRPDDLSAQVVAGLLAKLPQLDPALVEDLYWGCAEPSGKHGSNIARVIAVLAGLDHLPAAFHAIKAGEGDIFISGGVECVSQYTNWAGAGAVQADTQNPRFAPAAERSAAMAAGNRT